MQLFVAGDVLRPLTVVSILTLVSVLAFARVFSGEVAASSVSGVAGYVLGGTSRPKREAESRLPKP